MTTIIERESSGSGLLLIFVMFIILVGGLTLGYMNGMFDGKTTVIENHKTINNTKTIEKTVEKPAEPETSKP